MSLELQTALLSGVGLGSLYALVALAYSFIYRMTGTFNFAQGVLVTVGSLFAYTLYMAVHLPAIAAVVATALIVCALGVVNERVAIWPVARRGDDGNVVLISTLGFGLVASGIAERIWGTQPLGVNNFLPFNHIRLGSAQISSTYLVAFIAMIAAYVAVAVFERVTSWGLVMKAVSQNPRAVELSGVNVIALGAAAFAFGGLIAGFAGFVLAPVTFAVTTGGFTISILAFAGLAIGGFTSHWGAMLGGLVVGLVQSLGATYIGTTYQNTIVLCALTVVLLIRPEGLLAARTRHV